MVLSAVKPAKMSLCVTRRSNRATSRACKKDMRESDMTKGPNGLQAENVKAV